MAQTKKTYYRIFKAALSLLALLGLISYRSPDFTSRNLGSITSYLTDEKIDEASLLDCKASQLEVQVKDFAHLGGRTIYFIGDSTIRQQFEELCIISGLRKEGFMKDRNLALNPGSDVRIQDRVYLCENEDFRAVFLGMHRHGWQTPKAVRDIYNQLVIHDGSGIDRLRHSSKPDVVYFNGALHFLHLDPYLDWKGIKEWHETESIVNQFIDEVAGFLNPGGSLIFMRAHAICDEKYKDSYRDAVAKFNDNPVEFGKSCVEHILEKGKYPWGDSEDMLTACWQSSLTSDGVARMNRRVEETIIAAVEKKQSLLVGCVDGFKLTKDRCEDTEEADGRHYRPRIPLEILSLVESIREVSTRYVESVRDKSAR